MGCQNCIETSNESNSELYNPFLGYQSNLKNKNFIDDLGKYRKEILELINIKRKEHGTEPLEENNDIKIIAQQYAEEISKSENLINSNNKYNGEDLGESIFSYSTLLDAKGLIMRLSKKELNYDYNIKEEIPSHFTQMIWKNTNLIGIGISRNFNTGHMFYVLNYFPKGNIKGNFKENVFPISI